jgi:hypothetical protein
MMGVTPAFLVIFALRSQVSFLPLTYSDLPILLISGSHLNILAKTRFPFFQEQKNTLFGHVGGGAVPGIAHQALHFDMAAIVAAGSRAPDKQR